MNFSWRSGLLAVLVMLTGTQAQAQLRRGLVSYWPLNVIETDHTPDLISGNHLFLYNLGETNVVKGKYGRAFSFDGISQFLALSYAVQTKPKLPIVHEENYTISFWVKAPPLQTNVAIFAEGFTLADEPLFQIGTHPTSGSQGLNVYLRSWDDVQLNNITAGTPVFDNDWHHVVWVDRNGQAQLYIDGLLDVTSFSYQRRPARLNDLSIGALFRDLPTAFFKGLIDDVALWDRALTQQEIAQMVKDGLDSLFGSEARHID